MDWKRSAAIAIMMAGVAGCGGSVDNQEGAINLGAIEGKSVSFQVTLTPERATRHFQFDASGTTSFRVSAALTAASRLPVWNYLQAQGGDVATATYHVGEQSTWPGSATATAEQDVFDNRVHITGNRLLEDNTSPAVPVDAGTEILALHDVFPGNDALTYDVTVSTW
jgi:hypothetical protein